MKVSRVTRHRLPVRNWLPARLSTVPAGVALGAVLVTAAVIAGVIGIDPLPGFEPARRATAPTTGPQSAVQPEVRASLLAPSDLPPGYTAAAPAPSSTAGPAAAGTAAGPGHLGGGTDTAAPGILPLPPDLLPDLTDLSLEDLLGDGGLDGWPGDDRPDDGDSDDRGGPPDDHGPAGDGDPDDAPDGAPDDGGTGDDGPGDGGAW